MGENFITAPSVYFPRWLKLVCFLLATAVFVLSGLKYLYHRDGTQSGTSDVDPQSPPYPLDLNTIWPTLSIRIDAIARVENSSIIAEWAYVNNNNDLFSSFTWGFSQPNLVSTSKIVDANGAEYPVARNRAGTLLCADTTRPEKPGWSKEIFGGRDLPVWARFEVPEDAPLPLQLHLQGLNIDGRQEIEIKLLNNKSQSNRAYRPRATNWPDIFIQLEGCEWHGSDEVVVKWNYVNQNKDRRFIWGLNQPNFVSQTQLYDHSTGTYHDVAEIPEKNRGQRLCSSTNLEDGSGWSHSIPANSALSAYATFRGVRSRNIQILFHSAMPLFYKTRTREKL